MAGYVRNDVTNNIADGNIINAADLDGEFDAIQAAFVNTTGHTHDGTASEGAPITKIGPTQDVVVSTAALLPKTTNTLDLGSNSLKFKDIYATGTAYVATLDLTNALAVADGGTGATTLTGVLKGNGTSAFTAATANTDYLAPALANTAVTGFKTATFNSQTTIATTSGSITIDWTAAQNQLQTEPTGTITYTFTAPPGPCHLQLIIDSDGTSTAQTINWPGTVIQYGATWAGANNKRAVINFWYDGANYHMIGTNQV